MPLWLAGGDCVHIVFECYSLERSLRLAQNSDYGHGERRRGAPCPIMNIRERNTPTRFGDNKIWPKINNF